MKHQNILEHSPFDATISALNAETSALGVAISVLARSFRQYRHGVSADIGDCGVGITLQMCNRVTNHGDMGTFPNLGQSSCLMIVCVIRLDKTNLLGGRRKPHYIILLLLRHYYF